MVWWILDPLVNTLIYYLLFGVFFKKGGPDFVPFLMIGVVGWIWFSATISGAARSILANVGFVRQVAFMKIVFPVTQILVCTYQFCFSLVILFLVLTLYGVTPSASWLMFPCVLGIELLFICGLSLLLSAIVPFVPDLTNLIPYLLRLLFFFSGVMYKHTEIGPVASKVLAYNPMVHILNAYRDTLMYNAPVHWPPLIAIGAGSLVMMYFGAWLISRFDNIYAKRIIA